MPVLSVVAPFDPDNSTCGYCGPPGKRSATKSSYHAGELLPLQLSCEVYQSMIDRGWRRSGTFCYKPDLKRSCCPQYTIKLDALQFKPSKSQRKLVNRFNRFITHGDDHDHAENTSHPKGGKASSNLSPFALDRAIHASEKSFLGEENSEHAFLVTLEPSSFTQEKFALYQNYQKNIHQEEEEKSPRSFKRFLVESPLHREAIQYPTQPPQHLPREYGAYHQLYRLDGELIAVGVIDILPNCVSSVYFMYDKKWERFSLGKISALREVTLAKEIHDAGVPDMKYLYLGFYVHSCPKMRYKGEYSPSYLADPEEYTWHPLEECKPLLSKHRYASFAHPEHSIVGPFSGPEHNPQISATDLQKILVVKGVENSEVTVIPVTLSSRWHSPSVQRAVRTAVDGLGLDLAQEVLFELGYVD